MATGTNASASATVPVAPNAVRVWRGFRLESLSHEDFFQKLGSIFLPGTVQIQSPVGLVAYLPSVLPAGKPAAAPDEIAIVFYETQDAYKDAKKTVGGRAYGDLHDLVFAERSLSGFPQRFEGQLEADMRYHLFDEHIDWQRGWVNVFVGVRSGGEPQDFLAGLSQWLVGVQQGQHRPDGAIASASADYVVYWEHWPDEACAGHSQISALGDLSEPVYQQPIAPYVLSEKLWDVHPGVQVSGGESFNFQFQRRRETA